jgi:transposase InsO family protein
MLFYRWRKRFTLYGDVGLHPRQTGERRGRPPQLGTVNERQILAIALAWPTWGPQRISLQLARDGFIVSSTTVWRALRRVGLGTRVERLLALEGHGAAGAGLLTERTRRSLSLARTRHVHAEEPGELVCLDTFYIGKLKGVGKMWQLTACDAASSYALAKVVAVCNADQAGVFLRDVVAPVFAKAGWRLQRVLTDGGSEFKGKFDKVCRELLVRHTRTKCQRRFRFDPSSLQGHFYTGVDTSCFPSIPLTPFRCGECSVWQLRHVEKRRRRRFFRGLESDGRPHRPAHRSRAKAKPNL